MASYNDIIGGLEILAKHEEQGRDSHNISASHDVIYAGSKTPDLLPAEDRNKLLALRWHWDEGVDSWARYV